jgi:hypothetical protein
MIRVVFDAPSSLVVVWILTSTSYQLLIILLMLHIEWFCLLIGLFRNHARASHIFEHLSQTMEYKSKLIGANRTDHKLSKAFKAKNSLPSQSQWHSE